MGETTGIQWTDHSWNPWQGCHKVSAGCKNCYMYREKKRYKQDPATVVQSSPGTFRGPLTWHEPALVFTCSWSDFFIEEADPWRPEAWAIIRQTPHLTYQILTKRPWAEYVKERLPRDWKDGYPNVWLGVTVEDAENAWRVADLIRVPARLYFVSVEPMLGPVPLGYLTGAYTQGRRVGWVIAGGESGPGARPTELDWARDLRDQCQCAGVPFFLKQLTIGGRLVKMPELDGKVWAEMP